MRRKVFKSGNSTVVSLPPEIVEHLGVSLGDEVEIEIGENEREVMIIPAKAPVIATGVDEDFARQVSDFIEQYRPTLEALAHK